MEPTERKTNPLPRHFYSLDALRGLAALSVVFWHWQDCFLRGTTLVDFNPQRQPLYWLFMPLYAEGWRAVELFFCLSGFIFYWLYSEKIWTRETSLKEFVVLRFSRLYPLHFLTLLLVAAGQQVMIRLFGSPFGFSHNDLYHFGLQLVFASNWGFERGLSFNGPIWSVSVEVLLYALFFVVCRFKFRRWWHLIFLIGFGGLVMRIGPSLVGSGVFSFFAGGMSFLLFARVWNHSPSRTTLKRIGVITCLLWLFATANVCARAASGHALVKQPPFFFELWLFPLTLFTLALWEAHRGTLGRRVAFLGNLSYSSYLLHFPLFMICVAAAVKLSVPSAFFYTPPALLLFFAVLITVSLCSYRYFERPAQSFIRARLLSAPPSCEPKAPGTTQVHERVPISNKA